MSLITKMDVGQDEVTIRLIGELDGRTAPEFNDLIVEAAKPGLHRLVLLVSELTYMSSAGLRCLVFAHQKMERGAEIVLVGTRAEVADTIKMTGFDQSVTMLESVEE